MPKAYHYTKGDNLKSILAEGMIYREGESGRQIAGAINPLFLLGVPPRVWLTTENEMPFTATPRIIDASGAMPFMMLQMSKGRGYEQWQHLCGGVYRLRFDTKKISAVRYSTGEIRKKLFKKRIREAFEAVPKAGGDDLDAWFHCRRPVSMTYCEGIETWRDGYWVEAQTNSIELMDAA